MGKIFIALAISAAALVLFGCVEAKKYSCPSGTIVDDPKKCGGQETPQSNTPTPSPAQTPKPASTLAITPTKSPAPTLPGKCTDSDGGLNYFTKGTVLPANGGSYEDECLGEKTVIETYCEGKSFGRAYHDCPQGRSCINGACMEIIGAAT